MRRPPAASTERGPIGRENLALRKYRAVVPTRFNGARPDRPRERLLVLQEVADNRASTERGPIGRENSYNAAVANVRHAGFNGARPDRPRELGIHDEHVRPATQLQRSAARSAARTRRPANAGRSRARLQRSAARSAARTIRAHLMALSARKASTERGPIGRENSGGRSRPTV